MKYRSRPFFNALWSGARGNRTPGAVGDNPGIGTIRKLAPRIHPKKHQIVNSDIFPRQKRPTVGRLSRMVPTWNLDYHLKPLYPNFDHPSIASLIHNSAV